MEERGVLCLPNIKTQFLLKHWTCLEGSPLKLAWWHYSNQKKRQIFWLTYNCSFFESFVGSSHVATWPWRDYPAHPQQNLLPSKKIQKTKIFLEVHIVCLWVVTCCFFTFFARREKKANKEANLKLSPC